MAAATFNMRALITMRNAPKVRSVKGNVAIFNRSPSVTLTRPMTTAAIIAVPKPSISMPGTRAATITRLTALSSQLTSRCRMVSDCNRPHLDRYGATLHGHVRIRVSKLEAALLSSRCAGKEIPGALRQPPALGGNQLHLPAATRANHTRKLGEGDARGISLCLQGQSEDHAYPAVEGCFERCGIVLALDRSAALGQAAEADFVSTAAQSEMRNAVAG